jgi:hypothetical protein
MRGRVAPANVAKASPRIVWPIHGPNPASRDQPATVLVVPDDFVDCAGRMPKRSRWPEGLATGSVGYRGLPPVPQPKIKDPPQGRVFYFGWDTRIRYARSQPPRFKDLQSSKSAMWEHCGSICVSLSSSTLLVPALDHAVSARSRTRA